MITPDISTIEKQNSVISENKTASKSFHELSPTTSQSETKWADYFSPSPSVWGIHIAKPNSQVQHEKKVVKAIEQSLLIDPFQTEIELNVNVSKLRRCIFIVCIKTKLYLY